MESLHIVHIDGWKLTVRFPDGSVRQLTDLEFVESLDLDNVVQVDAAMETRQKMPVVVQLAGGWEWVDWRDSIYNPMRND